MRKLLNEYRTRLIADVVTGKLDVREAVVITDVDPIATEDTLDDTLDTNAHSDLDRFDDALEEAEV